MALNQSSENTTPQNRRPMGSSSASAGASASTDSASSSASASTPSVTLVPNNTLITNSPEEGRALAIKLARLIVKATQPDEKIRLQLREVYANDAAMLIQVTHVTAIEFATIAAANNYWRKQ